jgi:hypothetical protein
VEERAPACALHIGQMLELHRQVTAARDHRPGPIAMDGNGRRGAGKELAGLYEDLSAVLNAHLSREVTGTSKMDVTQA